MRKVNALRWLMTAGALTLASLASAQVRINEIHYDNLGTDAGEAIEVSAPAGTDLTGWSVVLYNGSNGQTYDTDALSGVVAASCGTRGVVVLNYPANGIQNGSPDAIALVNNTGAVVEFLSYEGPLTAANGPANGLTATDIVAFQNGNGPIGETLQRNAAGAWALANGSFGICNDDGETPPDPEVASVIVSPTSTSVAVGGTVALSAAALDASNAPINGVTFSWISSNPVVATVSATGSVTALAEGVTSITATAPNGVSGSSVVTVTAVTTPPVTDFRINEIHYDNLGTDAGEAVEIEGPAGASIAGFSIVPYNGNGGVPYGTPPAFAGALPASCDGRGVAFVTFPQDGLQNGSPDGIALVNNLGQVLDFISYEGPLTATSGPAAGLTATDIVASQTNAPVGTSLQRLSTGLWDSGTSSFGACNPESPVPPANTVQITGRTPGDVPLPVGFEDQLFGRLASPSNQTIPSTFTWEALTPDVATIDARGVIRALAVGSASFRATAVFDGTTATLTLPTTIAVASATAQYANNAEFGEPVDADPTDDLIIIRPQFTSSWNPNRGSPNWVAYEIDATHFGAEDRCDCFTMDADLPASLPRIDTADYTGAGDFHGYGIDRGHLARSFDRTAGSLDNATTFYFSNIVPQAADQNQGPWAQFENHLGDFARFQDREVYVLAGVAGNKGTIKNEGKLVIPTHTWKVALILPRDQGLADVRDYRDVQVLAVIMPNEPGVRNVPWQTYLTTVDAVETLSGYDLLALLEDDTENAVESATQPPIGSIVAPANVLEGDTISFSATGSVDPNGSVVSYAWDFGDGSSGAGVTASHTYAQDGVYTVRLTLVDNDGLADSTLFTLTVNNVAPVVGAVPNGSVALGATYSVNGSFSDPGADIWTATVVWGDGSAPEVVALSGRSFTLTHIYAVAGSYPVSIQIADDDGSSLVAHTVTVEQPAPTLGQALTLIDQLVAGGKMPRSVGIALKAQVIAAQVLIGRGNVPAARVVLRAAVIEIDLLVRLRVLKAEDVAGLKALLRSV